MTEKKKDCTHHLRKIVSQRYRYRCVKCGVKQKIANGLILDELEKIRGRKNT